MRFKTIVILVIGLATAACRVGPRLADYGPATAVRGAQSTFVLTAVPRVERPGELIAVREDDFLVLTSDGLERIPHDAVREADFVRASPDHVSGAGSDRQRRDLARYSRYPQGLTAAQLDALLAGLGQDALIEVAR